MGSVGVFDSIRRDVFPMIPMDMDSWRRARLNHTTTAGMARAMAHAGAQFDDLSGPIRSRFVLEALIAAGGNYLGAAQNIGVHRNTITRAVAALGLTVKDVRKLVIDLKRPR